MSKLIHTSRVRIEKDKGPIRRAYIEEFDTPIRFGVHTNIKKFYGVEPEEELPATLDHIVAAVGGWLVGTLGGALEVRKIPSYPDRLTADVEGDIEEIDGILVLTKIRVLYRVKVPKDQRAAAERALATHEAKCPAATSVKRGIAVEWKADIEEI